MSAVYYPAQNYDRIKLNENQMIKVLTKVTTKKKASITNYTFQQCLKPSSSITG